MIEFWIAIGIVIIAFFYDITTFKIPNWLSICALSIGFVIHLVQDGISGIGITFIEVMAGFLPMWGIYLLKGIGAGDVKLFGALATLIGVANIFEVMIVSFLIAGVISIVLIGYQNVRKIIYRLHYVYNPYLVEIKSDRKLSILGFTKVHQFPFMLAVTPAVVIKFLLI